MLGKVGIVIRQSACHADEGERRETGRTYRDEHARSQRGSREAVRHEARDVDAVQGKGNPEAKTLKCEASDGNG